MSRIKTLQALFRRYRRPGDIVFAWAVLIFSVFLLSQITQQTAYSPGKNIVTQPRFWPMVSLTGMTVFAAFHLLGSALSERLTGRWSEVWLWVTSLEYAAWFVLYAILVPVLGYLPSTMIFAVVLALRVGYRSRATLVWATASAIVIVVLFKTILQVRLPAGQIYEALPDGLRQIFLTYF